MSQDARSSRNRLKKVARRQRPAGLRVSISVNHRSLRVIIVLVFGPWAVALRTLDFSGPLRRPPPARFEKEIVHSLGDQFVFAIAEFPFRIEPFEFGGNGLGGGVSMFLEVETFLAQPGERVDHPGVKAVR